ncbi:MAG: hypothetical protein Q7J98_13705 [Kiritimatiellia bacterium]|nr:hypothetical protein [Kiritimatiellia bacterium]
MTGLAGDQPEVEYPPCWIDYYFVPGCEQCLFIEEDILPRLKEMFSERIKIGKHNLYSAEEYNKAQNILNHLAVHENDNIFVIVGGEIYVGGLKNIRENLIPVVEERLLSGPRFMPPDRGPAQRPPAGNAMRPMAGGYSFHFSFATLLVAGFLDGLNPCAFATIVFLISSLLAGGKGRREHLFLIGLGFCISVYLTYFLIGLGLFQIFRLSFLRLWLSNLVNGLLIIGLLVMAFISFRDAWLFRRNGRQKDIVLKLPGMISRFIHNIIRSNLPRKYYFAGSFFLGCVVTILESVCTGQLYVPALAFLARTSPLKTQAIAGLALYNVMFILPLVAVFVLAYHGVGQRAFTEWSRKDFFWSKCALGCFFIFLAVVLYLA